MGYIQEDFYNSTTLDVADEPFKIIWVGVSQCDGKRTCIERNGYPYICYEFILGGRGCVEIDGQKLYPEMNEIFCLSKNSNHRYFFDAKRAWSRIWFAVDGAAADALNEAYGLGKTVLIKNAAGLENYFYRIFNLIKDAGAITAQTNLLCAHIFHEFLAELYKRRTARPEPPDVAEAMKNYIDEHYTQDLSINDIAEGFEVSASQIIRIFKLKYGITPHNYFLNKKIEYAKVLLESSHLSVKEIAFRLGYNDDHYFSKSFKRITGKTPGGYTKSNAR